MITWYVIVLQVHTRKRQEKQAEEAAAQIPRGTNITSSFCVECFCQAYLRLMLTCNFTCSQKTSRRLSMWRSLHSTCSMEYRQRGRSSLQVHMEPTNICFLYMCIHIAIIIVHDEMMGLMFDANPPKNSRIQTEDPNTLLYVSLQHHSHS